MSLRQKLFLLLALIALVPLAVLAGLGVRASQNLALRLSTQSRDALVGDITQLLARNVQANSRYLNSQADIVELSLQLQVAAVERELRSAPPDLPLYFAARFDGPRTQWPPHTSLTRLDDAPLRMAVSTSVGSVMVPHGVDPLKAHGNLERLAGTMDTPARARRNASRPVSRAIHRARRRRTRQFSRPRKLSASVRFTRALVVYRGSRGRQASLDAPDLFRVDEAALRSSQRCPCAVPAAASPACRPSKFRSSTSCARSIARTALEERIGASSLGALADQVATVLVVPAGAPASCA